MQYNFLKITKKIAFLQNLVLTNKKLYDTINLTSRTNATELLHKKRGDIAMVNTDKLRGAIKERAMTNGDVAVGIGINPSTFSLKINSGKFTLDEADNISKLLNLSCGEATAIFFSQDVAEMQQSN